ncbi:uncharacterized protein E5676_scaffold145G00140 [Cucumis melo var. makuwa]|uniref:Reverse transcriptase domain-containing protein n=1 Tax=Cucumis melo var. makuwa TaxID=1194695 RepID=A0A5D3BUF9_CUCMM|nr:uncharacterized protein E6C27_scaffold128G002930 [Cucumis melo var. makuwa]TYK02760.1 uncharacterized protein E5676_scaffold145G00140 [Cucumis melo var. makuwa]
MHPDVMSVMMADITAEAVMAEMERKFNFLMKVVEERDREITGIKPRTLKELATRAHDMELSISSRRTKDFFVPEIRKDKKETKGVKKVVKSTVKVSMVVNTIAMKFSKRKEVRAERKDDGSERRRLTLKERQEKVYPFLDSNIADMLEQLLEKQLIQLPESREKKIELDLEKVAQTNHAAETIMTEALLPRLIFEQRESLVQFGTFKPMMDENPKVVACHTINATEEESIPSRSLKEEEVSKDLSRFNVDDLLSLPQETKTILINALLNSTTSSSRSPIVIYESTPYCMSIDFSDEDLLLGSKLHNRPLYVFGYVREQIVDQILLDNRSAVNIMPKSTMRQLGILMDELSNSKLVIQGLNQGRQRVIGMICLELIISDLKASALFHNTDSRTTYKLLLRRLWIHGNGVVTLTLNQCFKFYQDSVKKVETDSNPFSKVESHFVDAKFYLKNGNSLEAVHVEIPLVNREDNLQLKSLASREPHKSTETFNCGKGEASTGTTKSMILMDEKTSNPPILRYIPLLRCKKGESPFVESPQGLKVGDIEVLKESFTTSLTKITKQGIKIDLTEPSLPQRHTKDMFDPKAYKLMAKAGYDLTTHIECKSLKIHEQPELSSIQKKLLWEGHAIPVLRKGLRYKSQGSLNVKRHDVILTNPKKEDSEQGEGETSCHHITILEELEIETPEEDKEDAQQSLEDGGQSTVDELKEVNLGTIEEPRPTFINVSLSSEEEDEEMAAFRTPKGIYCYKVMPFGLKNDGATYQRAMQKVFDDMLHKYVECYVDDLVVKSKRRQDHLKDLKVVFDQL